MTTAQKKKILVRIQHLESDISQLKEARLNAGVSGFASATITSNGGSKSYTRLDPSKISDLIAELTKELKSLRAMLASGSSLTINTIATVYS